MRGDPGLGLCLAHDAIVHCGAVLLFKVLGSPHEKTLPILETKINIFQRQLGAHSAQELIADR